MPAFLVNLSIGVFAFVCCCLPFLFGITLGGAAGIKQEPAESFRLYEPNTATCRAIKQSPAICPELPNKACIYIYIFWSFHLIAFVDVCLLSVVLYIPVFTLCILKKVQIQTFNSAQTSDEK